MLTRTFNWRTFGIIAAATLLGAAWALFNFVRSGGNGGTTPATPLVWIVFAIPFFTFWGWWLARRDEGWVAAFVCFCIYFFSVFVGSRIELLILGMDTAKSTFHALYFQMTPLIQIVACIVVAAHRATTRGTIHPSTES